MTNEELKAAIELFSYIEGIAKEMPDNPYAKSQYNVLLAARELSQLKDGTHPDMVMVPREPTEEMITSYNNIVVDCGLKRVVNPKMAWHVMIAAAALKGGA